MTVGCSGFCRVNMTDLLRDGAIINVWLIVLDINIDSRDWNAEGGITRGAIVPARNVIARVTNYVLVEAKCDLLLS